MVFGLLAALACGGRGDPASGSVGAQGEVKPTLRVDITARMREPGTPAAWTAQAVWGPASERHPPSPGVCRPVEAVRSTGSASVPGVVGGLAGVGGRLMAPAGGVAPVAAVVGPTSAPLAWEGGETWSAAGPRQSLDPAWSVSDLAWRDAAGEHLAEDIVRFGGVPDVTRVVREREGDVELAWDVGTVDTVQVWVAGPGGLLECGVGDGVAVLPWWAVPPVDGELVLRSWRLTVQEMNGVRLEVRTAIERVVPLDQGAGTTAEEEPSFQMDSPSPRRVLRRARPTFG